MSQQLSKPGIGGGKPSLAKTLRYAGPIDGFPSSAAFAASTSIIYLLSAIACDPLTLILCVIYLYMYRYAGYDDNIAEACLGVLK